MLLGSSLLYQSWHHHSYYLSVCVDDICNCVIPRWLIFKARQRYLLLFHLQMSLPLIANIPWWPENIFLTTGIWWQTNHHSYYLSVCVNDICNCVIPRWLIFKARRRYLLLGHLQMSLPLIVNIPWWPENIFLTTSLPGITSLLCVYWYQQ